MIRVTPREAVEMSVEVCAVLIWQEKAEKELANVVYNCSNRKTGKLSSVSDRELDAVRGTVFAMRRILEASGG